jgi:hypothetical protein
MKYLILISFGTCLVTFVVTSFVMGRILIELGIKESMFYNFDNYNLFLKLIKELKSLAYKVLFWVNIFSLLASIAILIFAANYY